MFKKLWDKLFPKVCNNKFRSHCGHYKGYTDIVLARKNCASGEQVAAFHYKCCRCGNDNYIPNRPDGW